MTQDAKNQSTALATTNTDPALSIAQAAGFNLDDFSGAEVIQSGGLTKWVDLRKFMADPNVGDKEPVAGNGKAFGGALLSRCEIPVSEKERGEVRADGTKVRFYYLIRLMSPCPVAYKDENKDDVEEIAQPGEVVAIGERDKLKPLREMCEDGGLYLVAIKPHSRIKIGGGRTMWTFDISRKVVRPAAKLTVLGAKNPF